jgi:ABC-type bacteriocin/lantibiotic exporter with double-glycine peptidase domain
MRSKLRFHRQETPDSCVPACLRMVLMAMGLEIGEAELRERCDCTVFGTDALMAVDAVRALGFGRTRKETSTIAGLMDALALGIYPIVFLNVLPIDGVKGAHAMVLVGLEGDLVYLCDPRWGDRVIARSALETGWAMMRGLVILVEE